VSKARAARRLRRQCDEHEGIQGPTALSGRVNCDRNVIGTHQKTSARQYSTSSLDSRGGIIDDPSDRTISTSVDGFAEHGQCGGVLAH
jgi:hypothetical protein